MRNHRYMAPEERLLAQRSVQPNGCWHWTGGLSEDGYGRCGYEGRTGVNVHRVAYEIFVGAIPDGLTINHRCHDADPACPGGRCDHRRCFNPEHLEAVTNTSNILSGKTPAAINAAKVECVNGHPFTPDNTYIRPDGYRGCRICRREAGRRHESKRRPRRRGTRNATA